MSNEKDNWDSIIEPKTGLFKLNLKEVWKYRDLLSLFVRRDFVSAYKQTVLGPLWFIVQPVLTSLIFTFIFSNIAQLPTDGIPPQLFYFAGITAWTYFADCLTKTSGTFISNASVFGKVYFPRLIVPLSVVISNLIKFLVQFALFIALLFYYQYNGAALHPNKFILLTPFLLFIMAGLGLGFGIIISALTTKYRDLTFLIGFGVQLLMYGSCVVFPLSGVSDKYKPYLLANPMTSIIEAFKFSYLGSGTFNWYYILYSSIFMLATLFIGVIVFNRVERSFMDTV